MPRWPFARSVTAITTITPPMRAVGDEGLRRRSAPSSRPGATAVVRMPAASLPAPASVSPQAPSTSPRTRRGRYCCFLRVGRRTARCARSRARCAPRPTARSPGRRAPAPRCRCSSRPPTSPRRRTPPETGCPSARARASFGSRSIGKCCASSHSITCGPISASANSRTVRRRSCCSSVGRKSIGRNVSSGNRENGQSQARARAAHRRTSSPSRIFDMLRHDPLADGSLVSRVPVTLAIRAVRARIRLRRRHRVPRHEPDAHEPHGEGPVAAASDW